MKNTEMQINAMKNDYRFGVEIEMNHITRENAAKVAAEFFGDPTNYHDTRCRNGYMTWSAWDAQGREWKFSRDVSIAGPDSEKCEMITPVLGWEDIPTLQELLRTLRKAGAVSNPMVGAGVHIHVSRKDGFECRDIVNLVNIMAAHETQIGRAIRIDEGRAGSYCKTISKTFLDRMHSEKPKTMSELEDIWYEGNNATCGRTQHYNDSRYHMLNLHSLFHGHGTVEFRLFQFSNPYKDKNGVYKKGGIHAGEIKAYIQLCIAMCELAHEVKYASAKAQQTENEAYAFRCWMLRLGFIGEEFATAREILLRNMEGNSAWRSGH